MLNIDPCAVAEVNYRDVIAELHQRPSWMRDALCAEYPSLPWVPTREGATAAACKAVCARCLVRRECLAYALDDASLVGVWGGTSPRERRRLRAVRRREAA